MITDLQQFIKKINVLIYIADVITNLPQNQIKSFKIKGDIFRLKDRILPTQTE